MSVACPTGSDKLLVAILKRPGFRAKLLYYPQEVAQLWGNQGNVRACLFGEHITRAA